MAVNREWYEYELEELERLFEYFKEVRGTPEMNAFLAAIQQSLFGDEPQGDYTFEEFEEWFFYQLDRVLRQLWRFDADEWEDVRADFLDRFHDFLVDNRDDLTETEITLLWYLIHEEIDQTLPEFKAGFEDALDDIENAVKMARNLVQDFQRSLLESQLVQLAEDMAKATYDEQIKVIEYVTNNVAGIISPVFAKVPTLAEMEEAGLIIPVEAINAEYQNALGIALIAGLAAAELIAYLDFLRSDRKWMDMDSIYRSALLTGGANAAKETFDQNEDAITEYEWTAALEAGNVKTGRGTCPRCFSGDTGVVCPDALAATRVEYDGILLDFESPAGNRISVTPDHPFLTPNGFIRAQDIDDSTDILYCPGLDFPATEAHKHNAPATFEEIFNFFRVFGSDSGNMGFDFHGEFTVQDCQVDIVHPDGFLRDDGVSLFLERVKQRLLSAPYMSDVSLTGFCEFYSVLFRVGLTFKAATGSPSMFDFFGFAHESKTNSGAFRVTANGNTVVTKSTPDCAFGNSEGGGYFVSGIPFKIAGYDNIVREFDSMLVDIATFSEKKGNLPLSALGDTLSHYGIGNSFSAQIEDVADFFLHETGVVKVGNLKFKGKRYFSGHVYDLQSFSSLYHVGGMFASNCAALDGQRYEKQTDAPPLPLHYRCRCLLVPRMAPPEDLADIWDDVEEAARNEVHGTYYEDIFFEAYKRTDLGRPTKAEIGKLAPYGWQTDKSYADWWEDQSESWQDNAIGPTRAWLVRKEKIEFPDIVDRNTGDLINLKDLPVKEEDLKAARSYARK